MLLAKTFSLYRETVLANSEPGVVGINFFQFWIQYVFNWTFCWLWSGLVAKIEIWFAFFQYFWKYYLLYLFSMLISNLEKKHSIQNKVKELCFSPKKWSMFWFEPFFGYGLAWWLKLRYVFHFFNIFDNTTNYIYLVCWFQIWKK